MSLNKKPISLGDSIREEGEKEDEIYRRIFAAQCRTPDNESFIEDARGNDSKNAGLLLRDKIRRNNDAQRNRSRSPNVRYSERERGMDEVYRREEHFREHNPHNVSEPRSRRQEPHSTSSRLSVPEESPGILERVRGGVHNVLGWFRLSQNTPRPIPIMESHPLSHNHEQKSASSHRLFRREDFDSREAEEECLKEEEDQFWREQGGHDFFINEEIPVYFPTENQRMNQQPGKKKLIKKKPKDAIGAYAPKVQPLLSKEIKDPPKPLVDHGSRSQNENTMHMKPTLPEKKPMERQVLAVSSNAPAVASTAPAPIDPLFNKKREEPASSKSNEDPSHKTTRTLQRRPSDISRESRNRKPDIDDFCDGIRPGGRRRRFISPIRQTSTDTLMPQLNRNNSFQTTISGVTKGPPSPKTARFGNESIPAGSPEPSVFSQNTQFTFAAPGTRATQNTQFTFAAPAIGSNNASPSQTHVNNNQTNNPIPQFSNMGNDVFSGAIQNNLNNIGNSFGNTSNSQNNQFGNNNADSSGFFGNNNSNSGFSNNNNNFGNNNSSFSSGNNNFANNNSSFSSGNNNFANNNSSFSSGNHNFANNNSNFSNSNNFANNNSNFSNSNNFANNNSSFSSGNNFGNNSSINSNSQNSGSFLSNVMARIGFGTNDPSSHSTGNPFGGTGGLFKSDGTSFGKTNSGQPILKAKRMFDNSSSGTAKASSDGIMRDNSPFRKESKQNLSPLTPSGNSARSESLPPQSTQRTITAARSSSVDSAEVKPLIVIDGMNVALYGQEEGYRRKPHPKFDPWKLDSCYNFYKSRGYTVWVCLKHVFNHDQQGFKSLSRDGQDILRKMTKHTWIAPSGTDDDKFLLQTAFDIDNTKDHNHVGIIISNDFYRQYTNPQARTQEEKDFYQYWKKNYIIKYSFNPKGAYVPSKQRGEFPGPPRGRHFELYKKLQD